MTTRLSAETRLQLPQDERGKDDRHTATRLCIRSCNKQNRIARSWQALSFQTETYTAVGLHFATEAGQGSVSQMLRGRVYREKSEDLDVTVSLKTYLCMARLWQESALVSATENILSIHVRDTFQPQVFSDSIKSCSFTSKLGNMSLSSQWPGIVCLTCVPHFTTRVLRRVCFS